MAKLDDYRDLRKVYEYNKEKATRLAEAMTEAVQVEQRLVYLKKIMDENINLKPFLWQTQDGTVKALHDIDDDHLRNIIGHKTKYGASLSDEMRAEAESRGIEVDTIVKATPVLRARNDDDSLYANAPEWWFD